MKLRKANGAKKGLRWLDSPGLVAGAERAKKDKARVSLNMPGRQKKRQEGVGKEKLSNEVKNFAKKKGNPV